MAKAFKILRPANIVNDFFLSFILLEISKQNGDFSLFCFVCNELPKLNIS